MKELYPFYERGVSSFEEVREYLASWLNTDINGKKEPIYLQGKVHFKIAGFVRAFVSHLALFEPIDCKFIFAIVADDGKDTIVPMSDYEGSYETMIDSAAHRYCQLWKIDS